MAAYSKGKNTEFVWEIRKMGFCEGGRKKNCLRVFIRRLPQTVIPRTGNKVLILSQKLRVELIESVYKR